MGEPLSTDLRSKLVAAVAGSLSCRSAAERFGVSAIRAVHWVRVMNTTSTVGARPQGGDKRSDRVEAFGMVIPAATEAQNDISLVK